MATRKHELSPMVSFLLAVIKEKSLSNLRRSASSTDMRNSSDVDDFFGSSNYFQHGHFVSSIDVSRVGMIFDDDCLPERRGSFSSMSHHKERQRDLFYDPYNNGGRVSGVPNKHSGSRKVTISGIKGSFTFDSISGSVNKVIFVSRCVPKSRKSKRKLCQFFVAKGRTNTELREQFTLADGTAQSRASFSSRRHSGKASNSGSDAGYSSASSSAGIKCMLTFCY